MIEAAGGIVFRWRADGIMKFSDDGNLPVQASGHAALDNIEVCVVHRPNYGDWSWPKGKLEANETHRHAAVREIGEETCTPVSLGAYLGEVEYPLEEEGSTAKHAKHTSGSSATKRVRYWMARPICPADDEHRTAAFGPVSPADHCEIDRRVWVNTQQAHRMLSHTRDRNILDLFVDRIEQGAAQTRNLIIVRHAKAEPRRQWTGADADRPITPRGAAMAYALDRELACFNPTRLVSSPWTRCVETLELFSWQTGYGITTVGDFTESAFEHDPDAAWLRMQEQFDDVFATRRCTVVCLHRPVIGGLFPHLRSMCASRLLASQLVAKSPYMPTGNAIALVVAATPAGPSIIDIQRIQPIVY